MGRYANVNLANLAFMSESSLGEKKQNFNTVNIHIDKIIPNERNKYSVQDIDELKFSILHNGLKQNLEVYDLKNGLYKLISGERRYTALRALVDEGYSDFSLVPCLVTDFSLNKLPLSESSKEMFALITTNSEARDFTEADRMFQVRELKKIYTELQRNGIKLTGKMSELIANDLDLSERQVKRFNYIEKHGTDELKEKIENNEISIRAAEAVAHLSPGQQRETLKKENISSTTADKVKATAERKKAKRSDNNIIKQNNEIQLSDTKFFNYDLTSIKSRLDYIEKQYSSSSVNQDEYRQIEIQTKELNRILDKIIRIIEQ